MMCTTSVNIDVPATSGPAITGSSFNNDLFDDPFYGTPPNPGGDGLLIGLIASYTQGFSPSWRKSSVSESSGQRCYRTGEPRYRPRPRQLDLLRQRHRRQDGGGVAKPH